MTSLIKKSLLLLSFLIVSLSGMADGYMIRGKVVDGQTNETIPYANVELKSLDGSEVVKAVFTGDDGRFLIEDVAENSYKLIISFMGYSDYNGKITPEILKREGGARFSIKLHEDVQLLSQVEIVGTRTQLQMDVDKKTFLVNEGATAVGVSATDVLRDIPTVDVDMEGNVSLRNNTNVEVFINGRSVGLSGDAQGDLLEQFPAGSIEKVEVITNPSSKYSAEGSAGIINIVLKQDAPAGIFGNVTTGISYPTSGKVGGNVGASLNITKGKWTILSALGYQRRTFRGSTDIDRYEFYDRDSILGRDTIFNETDGNRNFIINSTFARVGVDYKINDKNKVGLSGVMSLGKNRSDEGLNYCSGNFVNDVHVDTLSLSSRNSKMKSPRNMFTVKMDYTHTFGKEQDLTFMAQTSYNSSVTDRKYYQTPYDEISLPVQEQHNDRTIKKNQFAIDYSSPVGKLCNLELGVSVDMTNERNDVESFHRVYGSHEYVSQDILTNDFEYIQNVYAWYGMWSGKAKRLSYKLGLRGELSDISWIQHNTGITDDMANYGNLFPSLYLSYHFSDNDELQFSAIRRISRPRGYRLNPNPNMSDSTTINYGNPDLKPEEAFSGEMNYLHTTKAGHVYTLTAYYRFTDDVIEQYDTLMRVAEKKSVLNRYFANLNRSHSTGLELIAKNKFKSITFTTSFNLYYYRLVGGVSSIEVYNSIGELESTPIGLKKRAGFSLNIKEGIDFRLPKGFTGQYTFNFRSSQVSAQGNNKSSYAMNLGLKRQFFDKKLTIAFNVRDITNSNNRTVESSSSDFSQVSKTTRNGRTFNLNASYAFGNKDKNGKKANKDGKGGGDDDMNFEDF